MIGWLVTILSSSLGREVKRYDRETKERKAIEDIRLEMRELKLMLRHMR